MQSFTVYVPMFRALPHTQALQVSFVHPKTFYLYINPLSLVSCSIIYSSLCTYCNFSSMYPLLTMYIALEILVYSFVPFILLYTRASLPQSTFTQSYLRLDHCNREL